MGLETALLASVIMGGVGTAAGVIGQMDSSRRAKNQAEDAGRQAEQQAQQAAQQAEQQAQQASQQADQQFNRANQRRPDAMPGPAGAGGSTVLTGPQGIDPGALPLGKSTMLGQ